jgi:hypothetical protein
MRVERAFPGDRTAEFRKLYEMQHVTDPPEFAKGKTWLHVESSIDSRIDGDGEKMREWFLNKSRWLLKL